LGELESWIAAAAGVAFIFLVVAISRRSRRQSDSRAGRSLVSVHEGDLEDDDEDEDDYQQEPAIGSITFIQINQFITFNGSYPSLSSNNERIPRFVKSTYGFKAKGMQSRYHNFRHLLVSNKLRPGNEYSAVVTLQIEPSNKFDRFAVLVLFRGLPLAYVPREYSQAFHSVLLPVGGAAACLADIWFDGQFHRGGKRNSITLLTSTYPQLES
jgi:hypothetical protein